MQSPSHKFDTSHPFPASPDEEEPKIIASARTPVRTIRSPPPPPPSASTFTRPAPGGKCLKSPRIQPDSLPLPCLDSPGPIYCPDEGRVGSANLLHKRVIGHSFTRAKAPGQWKVLDYKKGMLPGPVTYTINYPLTDWKFQRKPKGKNVGTMSTMRRMDELIPVDPGPGTYDPTLPPRFVRPPSGRGVSSSPISPALLPAEASMATHRTGVSVSSAVSGLGRTGRDNPPSPVIPENSSARDSWMTISEKLDESPYAKEMACIFSSLADPVGHIEGGRISKTKRVSYLSLGILSPSDLGVTPGVGDYSPRLASVMRAAAWDPPPKHSRAKPKPKVKPWSFLDL